MPSGLCGFSGSGSPTVGDSASTGGKDVSGRDVKEKKKNRQKQKKRKKKERKKGTRTYTKRKRRKKRKQAARGYPNKRRFVTHRPRPPHVQFFICYFGSVFRPYFSLPGRFVLSTFLLAPPLSSRPPFPVLLPVSPCLFLCLCWDSSRRCHHWLFLAVPSFLPIAPQTVLYILHSYIYVPRRALLTTAMYVV